MPLICAREWKEDHKTWRPQIGGPAGAPTRARSLAFLPALLLPLCPHSAGIPFRAIVIAMLVAPVVTRAAAALDYSIPSSWAVRPASRNDSVRRGS